MSHRKEEKERLRAEREAAERERSAAVVRRRRLWILGGLVAAAAVAVVAIVVASSGSGDDEKPAAQKRETSALFAGVPQNGTSLGKADAPVVLTEFADLQCPFCRDFAVNALPGLVKRYVRQGKLRVELRLLRFLGPDSDRGARGAMAAGRQDRMWNFVEAFYQDQGEENTGYATDDFLTEVAEAAGVKPSVVLGAIEREAYEDPLVAAEAEARRARIESTPSFMVARKGGQPRRLELDQLTLEAVEDALGPELGR